MGVDGRGAERSGEEDGGGWRRRRKRRKVGSLPVKVAERKEKAVNSRRVCVRVSEEQRVSGQRGDPQRQATLETGLRSSSADFGGK